MAGWVTVPFIENDAPQVYTLEPHTWKSVRFFSWPVCSYCGLVLLKNDFTRWADRMGCNHTLHRDYHREWAKAGINPLAPSHH